MPPTFVNRVDPQTWSEFTKLCRDAASLPDASERKSQADEADCRQTLSFVGAIIGVLYASIGGGVGGSRGAANGFWISAIVLGILAAGAGVMGAWYFESKKGRLQSTFVREVLSRLAEHLIALNQNYANMIHFELRTRTVPSRQPKGVVPIRIEIQLLAASVPYIAMSRRFSDDLNSTPLKNLERAAPEPEIIVVQMPDGRMVPAQIIGNVEPDAVYPVDETAGHVAQAQPWPNASAPEEELAVADNDGRGEGEAPNKKRNAYETHMYDEEEIAEFVSKTDGMRNDIESQSTLKPARVGGQTKGVDNKKLEEIRSKLIGMGYEPDYIRRALRVYHRNYDTDYYHVNVLTEIIYRLHRKDQEKAWCAQSPGGDPSRQ